MPLFNVMNNNHSAPESKRSRWFF